MSSRGPYTGIVITVLYSFLRAVENKHTFGVFLSICPWMCHRVLQYWKLKMNPNDVYCSRVERIESNAGG